MCKFKEKHENFRIYKLNLNSYQRTGLKDERKLETSRQYSKIKLIVLTISFYFF